MRFERWFSRINWLVSMVSFNQVGEVWRFIMVYPDVCQVMVLFIWGKMTSLSLCFNCMTASHLLINEKAGRFGYHDSVQIQRASFMTRKKQQMMAEFKHSQLGGGFKYFLFSNHQLDKQSFPWGCLPLMVSVPWAVHHFWNEVVESWTWLAPGNATLGGTIARTLRGVWMMFGAHDQSKGVECRVWVRY